MHVHLIGVCGTGMGSLAGLLRSAGHRVTGSDVAFYPPMGDALRGWGIETRSGYDPAHLQPSPDLVVVGNVCRPDNPEARAAISAGLRYCSMASAIEELFLKEREPYVLAGTHGKTTTTALLAYLLQAAGRKPGFFIGGIPLDFAESFRAAPVGHPFVIEGDEYDSAFFEKRPKFWSYRPLYTAISAVEHDHVDIYPDLESYRAAFTGFIDRIAEPGLLVAFAGDPVVRDLAERAHCRVVTQALSDDDCDALEPAWRAVPVYSSEAGQRFDLLVDGRRESRMDLRLTGDHNLRNALAALALAHLGAGVPLAELGRALPGFRGVNRRQQLRGTPGGVRIYDDFAHHPTAVAETLRGMRKRHANGKLIAIFEPRSATASRRLHQQSYPEAFSPADRVFLAPVGRPEITPEQRLDLEAMVEEIRTSNRHAEAPGSIEAIVERVARLAEPGDTVVAMSNGPFGGIHDLLLRALTRPNSVR